eukprot:364558-Chlamydomonas_euryale.AAC.14
MPACMCRKQQQPYATWLAGLPRPTRGAGPCWPPAGGPAASVLVEAASAPVESSLPPDAADALRSSCWPPGGLAACTGRREAI